MKLLAAVLSIAFLALSGCAEKTTGEKVGDKIDDVFDNRPGEKVRDAAEEIRDAAKDVGAEVKDLGKEVEHAAKDVKEAVQDAAK